MAVLPIETQQEILKRSLQDPVGEAVQAGYFQENTDKIVAKHSAYSYEDLPSDKFGAEFGANYFNPDSKLSLGEQLYNYLEGLGATDPQNAPNYKILPSKEPNKNLQGQIRQQLQYSRKKIHNNDSKKNIYNS